jgi:signal transduction histidine kinase
MHITDHAVVTTEISTRRPADYRQVLINWLEEVLEASLFTNRSFIRPRQLKQIALAEAETYLAFLGSRDDAALADHATQRAQDGLGDQAVLRIAATLRRFCNTHLNGNILQDSLAATDHYTETFLENFIKAREVIVLNEQERIRAALQRAVNRYTLQLETAAEVAQTTSLILDLDELASTSVDLIRQRFDLNFAGLFLLDESNEGADLVASASEAGQEIHLQNHKLKIDAESAIGWSITHSKARVVLNLAPEATSSDECLMPNTRSAMTLPLISRGRIIGALTLQSSQKTGFGADDGTVLQPMANLLANAIENVRLYRELERALGELQSAHDELELRVEERTAELERSNQELQQFAYVASHDLQEPLRMVTSYLQLLNRRYENQLDSDAREFIAFAVDGASRMHRLINDLLAYSRVGTRSRPLEPTDSQAILDQVLMNLRVAIDETGAVVTHDPLPSVMADATQLAQLFQNLIGNAIKFRNERSPEIHIAVAQHTTESPAVAGRWLFSVRDNGIGIDPQYGERIFQIFQRLHGREEYDGTGIGLAICKRIVELHGGSIWVDSQPGEGATFHFSLPERT